MKPRRKISFSFSQILLFCLVIPVLTSCNWFEEHEYASVEVTNRTEEDIRVGTGKTFVRITVPVGQTYNIKVVKYETITARGIVTDHVYARRYFTLDFNSWIIR